ncbi:MAG: NADH:ubiquinone reductase (Na(+)-transporting) subunit B [Lewinella sp.]|nr:NADH:ubiquinone reductase (Na(+)-transporting) subunit B [Lewinella sp.]
MKKALLNLFERIEPDKAKSPLLHTAYDAFFTFAFTPNLTTKGGVHIRDGMDLKRTMVYVVLAMQLCYLLGTYNIGHQHFVALGEYAGLFEGFHLKLFYGLVKLLPIWIVSHVVGLGIEFYYAARRGHGVEEGYLVTGALIPLIMPPDIPLWILTLSIAFAVIIGKEAFGGTGMNVLNVALLARVFVFFAYPTYISGDEVWIAGIEKSGLSYVGQEYGGIYGFLDSIFHAFGWTTFGEGGQAVVDGFTGATPLGLAAKGGWDSVVEHYSVAQMWWGTIPGSIGETSKPFIIIGALMLILTKVADWRIIISGVLGFVLCGLMINGLAPDTISPDAAGIFKFMAVPWYYHFYMGSFLFAITFMATDPVTAASTPRGKWIYGFLIGFIGMIIRVMNPAYPEGWMLAILFMNVFAPLIDYYVLQGNVNRRAKRLAAMAKARVTTPQQIEPVSAE